MSRLQHLSRACWSRIASFVHSKDLPILAQVSPELLRIVMDQLQVRWLRAQTCHEAIARLFADLHWAEHEECVLGYRYDLLDELYWKANDGFDVVAEHRDVRLNNIRRIELESALLCAVVHGLHLLETSMTRFETQSEAEEVTIRFQIRYLDSVYASIHEQFLKAYLDIK